MQCDQIGRFFIVPLATNFLTKVAKIICECLDHYYKHFFIVITAWLLFGQLLEIFWAFFIPTSGHADGRVHARARINGENPQFCPDSFIVNFTFKLLFAATTSSYVSAPNRFINRNGFDSRNASSKTISAASL